MAIYEMRMRVIHNETWTVEAADEAEARTKVAELHSDVDMEDEGGNIIDWQIEKIWKTEDDEEAA